MIIKNKIKIILAVSMVLSRHSPREVTRNTLLDLSILIYCKVYKTQSGKPVSLSKTRNGHFLNMSQTCQLFLKVVVVVVIIIIIIIIIIRAGINQSV
jgi:hypothetical protein